MPWGNTKGREIERQKSKLTPEQIAEANFLRSKNMGWKSIARHIGSTEWQVMKVTDSEAAEKRRKYWIRKNASESGGSSRGHIRATPPPECLLADRDRRLYGHAPSLSQLHLGDPPPGQSALDKMRSPWARND